MQDKLGWGVVYTGCVDFCILQWATVTAARQ